MATLYGRWRRRHADVMRMMVRRILFLLPLLLFVTLGVFALAAVSPYDPIDAYLGGLAGELTANQLGQLSATLNLNLPWYSAWWQWMSDLFHGELGTSRVYHQSVVQVIADRLPWTLLLSAVGLVISVLIAFLAGVWAGRHPAGAIDRLLSALATTLQATPPFVLALAALSIFALTLNWVPTGGLTYPGEPVTLRSTFDHLLVPGIVLGITQTPWLIMSFRESIFEALTSDAVRGARVRGIPPRMIVLRHILPVALPPFVALVGARLSELVVGSVLVEAIFAWPGLGSALVSSAQSLDFPLLTFLTVAITVLILLGNLLADIVFVILDPRVDADA